MIEDKIHSHEHDAQFHYKECIEREYPDHRVLPIFFKTGDQCSYEDVKKAGFRCFLRKEFLSVLDEGIHLGVSHPIFCDFRDCLWEIERRVESFRDQPVASWPECKERWVGFFKELQKSKKYMGWKYVSNKAGGFLAAWWHYHEWMGEKVYLQIEEGKLCFKIETRERSNRSQVRDEWRERLFAVKAPKSLQLIRPRRMGNGTWMTGALIEQGNWLMTDAQGLLDMKATLAQIKQAERLLSSAVAR